jgi:predicted RNA-binding protein with PUA-like domain
MARWLLKTEPTDYSFADLQRDKTTTWNGVANPTAVKNIRQIKKGDDLLIYHTGNEKAIIGAAIATSDGRPDPANPRSALVDLKAAKPLPRPVTLAQIKADPAFAGWDLVRIGRLSVLPVPDTLYKKIEKLAGS